MSIQTIGRSSLTNVELIAAATAGAVAVTWGSIAFLGSAWSIGSSYPTLTLFSAVGLAALAGVASQNYNNGNKKQSNATAAEYLHKKYGHEAKNSPLKMKKLVDGLYNNTGLESCAMTSYSSIIVKFVHDKKINPLDAWVMMLTDQSMKSQLFDMKDYERTNLSFFINLLSEDLAEYQQNNPIAKYEFDEVIDGLIKSGFSFPNIPVMSDYTLKQPSSVKSWNRLLSETLAHRPQTTAYQFTIAEDDAQSLKNIMWRVVKENVFRGTQKLER